MCYTDGKKEFNNKGVILVEYQDNTRHILDLKSNKDITKNKNVDIGISRNGIFRTKIKDIFKEIL